MTMTFLRQLGLAILKGAQIVSGIAPIARTVLPNQAGFIETVSADLAQVAEVVTAVEAIGQALKQPGPAKLSAASPLVAQVILRSSVLAGKKIANEALFAQGAQKMADGMADVLNSVHADGVRTEGKT